MQTVVNYAMDMMILYLINTKEYNYHRALAEDFRQTAPGKVLDMSDGTSFGDRYYEIEEMAPDVVITFDLAGHVLRTGNDTLSLNNIYARFAHILFHKPEYYGSDLKCRQNLSMFTYVTNGEDPISFREQFPDVPNVSEFPQIYYKADSDSEHEQNRKAVSAWWEGFRKDAMI